MFKKLRKSPDGAAKLAAVEKYLKDPDSPIDGEKLVTEMLHSPEFTPVIEAATLSSSSNGLKAIGLGASYHYSFLKKGAEAITILPQTVGNTQMPAQGATRLWDYNTQE